MANVSKKKPRRKAVMLGLGLDSDGHKKLTAKGKQLEEVSHEEFDEIVQSVGMKRQPPKPE
jgi:hypothetical protein